MRLTPTGEASTGHSADYASVRPVPTPATTTGKRPFMLGGKRRKADR
jgi:hypothetical protein